MKPTAPTLEAPSRSLAPSRAAELCAAASEEAPERLLGLLELGADPNGRDPRGFPPLVAAAANGSLAGVRTLLDWGADPNVRCGVVHAPALAWCATRACADELVLAGADPNAVNSKGLPVPEAAKEARNEAAAAAADAERDGRDLMRARGAAAALARRTAQAKD